MSLTKDGLAKYHQAGEREVKMAIEASQEAKERWEQMPYQMKAAIFIKAAELLSGKYRYTLNAATMLNHSKRRRTKSVPWLSSFVVEFSLPGDA